MPGLFSHVVLNISSRFDISSIFGRISTSSQLRINIKVHLPGMISSGNIPGPRAGAGRDQRVRWTRGRSLLGLQTDQRIRRVGSRRRIGPPIVLPSRSG
jgi:hypothetical protein